MGINDLISQCAWRKIRSLRDVEESIHMRPFKYSTCQGPKPAENPKKRAFSAPIWATDHSIHSSMNLEGNFFNESISIWRDNWYFIKVDIILSLLSSALLYLVDIALL